MTGRCLLMLAAAVAARGQCLPVRGERILAGDLARAVPAFAGLAPELVLGYAPAPGARRVYGAAELSRLARRYGLAAEPGMEVCFARPLETLTSERVAAARARKKKKKISFVWCCLVMEATACLILQSNICMYAQLEICSSRSC